MPARNAASGGRVASVRRTRYHPTIRDPKHPAETRVRIKSIPSASGGKTLALCVMVVAFIVGVVRSLGWLVFEMGRDQRRRGPGFDDVVTGPLAFLAFPLFFGAIAFVVGFVTATIYNISAGITGGLEVEVEGDDGDAARRGKEFDW